MNEPKTTREKWFEQRDDLTGEHPLGDAGQIIFALLFFHQKGLLKLPFLSYILKFSIFINIFNFENIIYFCIFISNLKFFFHFCYLFSFLKSLQGYALEL